MGNVVTLHRPHLLTPERTAAILESVSKGAALEPAAEASGITMTTMDRWRQWGAEELKADNEATTPCACFVRDFQKARAEFEQECINIIYTAAPANWQAAAWLLERKFPGRYGKGLDRNKGRMEDDTKPQAAVSREDTTQRLIEKIADIAERALERSPGDDATLIDGDAEVVEDDDDHA